MKKDPRYKNKGISWSGFAETSSDYFAQIHTIMQSVSSECFDKFVSEIMRVARDDKLLLSAGNGGSASISNHIACDLSKGTFYDGVFRIRTVSLMSNSAMLTAISNDFGFEESIAFQLKLIASRGDLLVLVSSSGESKNIRNAVNVAKELGITVVGLTGFNGGFLRDNCDISLHVDAEHYALVEDSHMGIAHITVDAVNVIIKNEFGIA